MFLLTAEKIWTWKLGFYKLPRFWKHICASVNSIIFILYHIYFSLFWFHCKVKLGFLGVSKIKRSKYVVKHLFSTLIFTSICNTSLITVNQFGLECSSHSNMCVIALRRRRRSGHSLSWTISLSSNAFSPTASWTFLSKVSLFLVCEGWGAQLGPGILDQRVFLWGRIGSEILFEDGLTFCNHGCGWYGSFWPCQVQALLRGAEVRE